MGEASARTPMEIFARDFDGLFTLTYNNSNATGCGDNDGLGYMRGETPQVNLPAHCSGKTEQLGADSSPYVVKVALEALGNVEDLVAAKVSQVRSKEEKKNEQGCWGNGLWVNVQQWEIGGVSSGSAT